MDTIEITVEKEYSPSEDDPTVAVEADVVERVVLYCANGCGRVLVNDKAISPDMMAAVVERADAGELCTTCTFEAAQAAAQQAEAVQVEALADAD